jgi:hypothetical protein
MWVQNAALLDLKTISQGYPRDGSFDRAMLAGTLVDLETFYLLFPHHQDVLCGARRQRGGRFVPLSRTLAIDLRIPAAGHMRVPQIQPGHCARTVRAQPSAWSPGRTQVRSSRLVAFDDTSPYRTNTTA